MFFFSLAYLSNCHKIQYPCRKQSDIQSILDSFRQSWGKYLQCFCERNHNPKYSIILKQTISKPVSNIKCNQDVNNKYHQNNQSLWWFTVHSYFIKDLIVIYTYLSYQDGNGSVLTAAYNTCIEAAWLIDWFIDQWQYLWDSMFKKYRFAQKITIITSLENADYRSVNYLKISFRLWIINLKKQSLPQALRYFSVLYLPDGSCSRKSLMNFFIVNVAHDQCFSSFVCDCNTVVYAAASRAMIWVLNQVSGHWGGP